jgi:thioredoxin-like negative regulator of GroEL
LTNVIDIQHEDWEKVIVNSKKPVIIEFWHQKCSLCQEMKPIFKKLPEVMGDSISFTRMNVLDSRENRLFAIKQGVRGTPTFKIYCEGRGIGEIVGVRTETEMVKEISSLLDKKDSCLKVTPLR